jgi:hypothetical protein
MIPHVTIANISNVDFYLSLFLFFLPVLLMFIRLERRLSRLEGRIDCMCSLMSGSSAEEN